VPAPAPARIEPITGRYVHLDFGGRTHRVYFEEAGSGVPLVCLHTAGADGRQYRHLMVDEAVTAIAWSLYKPEHAEALARMAGSPAWRCVHVGGGPQLGGRRLSGC